ncbi:hypothetical protein Tco_1020835 [Tanacetum coccineum]
MLASKSRVNSCENGGKTPSRGTRTRMPTIILIESSTSRKEMGGQTHPRNHQHLGPPKEDLNLKDWERTSSKSIGSISNSDGLAAIVSKLDNMGRGMKNLKENIHAIQVEEVKYKEFERPAPFNENNGAKFCVGPPGYYTRTDNRPPYGEKRPSLEELMIKHQEESAR